MQQLLELGEFRSYYVLESFHPKNAKHIPRYKAVTYDELQAIPKNQLYGTGSRVHWCILPGAWPTLEEAQQYIEAQRGLRVLETPTLFQKLPIAAVAMDCGCVVSYDKRRAKYCKIVHELIASGTPHLKDFFLNNDDYRQASSDKQKIDLHLYEARDQLKALLAQREQQKQGR